MATSSNSSQPRDQQEASKNVSAANSTTAHEIDTIISALPTGRAMAVSIKQYLGCWFLDFMLPGIISIQEKFRGRSDHIILTSFPKSGTTWLKALLFCITNRSRYNFTAPGGVQQVNGDDNDHPLLSLNPHVCVPYIEFYATEHLDDYSNPDGPLLSTHLPYSLLPKSMIECGCKIVHVMREPKDVVVSLWHFLAKTLKETVAFHVAFDKFCDGFVNCGPYWDYVVEYVKASLKFPDTVYVLTYEDLMERSLDNVKRLADFIGQPFTVAEEDQGLVEGIVSFCSFDNLSNLEVNKAKTCHSEITPFTNDKFFRKGKIGDWRNYLNDEQRERIDGITRQKFKDIGGCLADYLGST